MLGWGMFCFVFIVFDYIGLIVENIVCVLFMYFLGQLLWYLCWFFMFDVQVVQVVVSEVEVLVVSGEWFLIFMIIMQLDVLEVLQMVFVQVFDLFIENLWLLEGEFVELL